MDKFFRSLWETLVAEEPVSVSKRAASPKHAVVKVTRKVKRRAVSPMPDLTLEPAIALHNATSYSMRNQLNKHSGKSPRLTGLAQLEKNRKRRYTLKQGHKAKTPTNK
jgi:hypothetical protein